MFYTVTRKTITLIIIIILCLSVPIAIGAAVINSTPSVKKPIIVIDAGHGGSDYGVKGINTGVEESGLNLLYARELKRYFEEAGFEVVMTRFGPDGLYGIMSTGFKKRDMQRRKEIIEKANPDLVISVHMNFYKPQRSRRGLQAFWADSGKSKELAVSIQNAVNRNVNFPRAGRNLLQLYGDYYILKCTDAPSVLIECGFLSNSEDEALLVSEEYRKELCYYIYAGAMVYFNQGLYFFE
jgi:N-acetylmuramoyl-L-alanine amidase